MLRHVSLPEHSLDEPRLRGEVYRSCRRRYGLQAADRIKENLSLRGLPPVPIVAVPNGSRRAPRTRSLGHEQRARPCPFRRRASGPIANGRPPRYSGRSSGKGARSEAGAAHRGVHLLGQRGPVPARSSCYRRAEDRHPPLGTGDCVGQVLHPDWIRPIRADALRATAGPRAGAGRSSGVSDRRHADRRHSTAHMLFGHRSGRPRGCRIDVPWQYGRIRCWMGSVASARGGRSWT